MLPGTGEAFLLSNVRRLWKSELFAIVMQPLLPLPWCNRNSPRLNFVAVCFIVNFFIDGVQREPVHLLLKTCQQ